MQKFILLKQQSDYESINLKLLDKIKLVLKNELKKLDAIGAPGDVNKLLSLDIQKRDMVPLLKKVLTEFIVVLDDISDDFYWGGTAKRNEYLSKDIKALDNKIHLKAQREWERNNDEIAMLEERYREMMRDYERSADYAPEDGDEAFEEYCLKRLNRYSREDLINEGDEDLAEEDIEIVEV